MARDMTVEHLAYFRGRRKSYQAFGDMHRLRKAIRESWDYFVTDKLVYCGEITDAQSVKWVPRHIERYVEGELWFEGRVRIHSLVEPFGDYDILFILDGKGATQDSVTIGHSSLVNGWCDDPVLVEATGLTKNPEQFKFRPIRSTVWLKAFNDVEGIVRDEPAELLESILRILFLPIDREADSVGVTFGWAPLRGFKTQSPHDVIQAGLQVREDVPDNQRPGIRDALTGRQSEDAIFLMREFLLGDGIGIAIGEPPNAEIQRIDVLPRPFSLEPGLIEWMPSGS